MFSAAQTTTSALKVAFELAAARNTAGARRMLRDTYRGHRLDANALGVLAKIFAESGRAAAAETALRRALKLQPTNLYALSQCIRLYWNPRNWDALLTIMLAYFEGGGTLQPIITVVRDVSQTGVLHGLPADARSDVCNIGRLYLLNGQFERARSSFAASRERPALADEIRAIDCFLDGKFENMRLCHLPSVHKWLGQLCLNRYTSEFGFSETLKLLEGKGHPGQSTDPSVGAAGGGLASPKASQIFMASLLKSGSGFINTALEKLTGSQLAGVSYVIGAEDAIVPTWFDEAVMKGEMPSGHCTATPHNIRQLERLGLPVFVHVRDPRDAAWSYFRWVEEMPRLQKMGLPRLPDGYVALRFEARLEAMYENHLPYVNQWLSDWKAYAETGRLPVLFMRYEDFSDDNEAEIAKLMKFCEAPVAASTLKATIETMRQEGKKSGAYHFRQGRASGWREAASPRILELIDSNWDRATMQYFGYIN